MTSRVIDLDVATGQRTQGLAVKNVQVDSNGQLHCHNCGAMAFTQKRTFRSKAAGASGAVAAGVLTGGIGLLAGAGTLATKKKLKCQACGTYNNVGNADPYVVEPEPQPRQVSTNAIDSEVLDRVKARREARRANESG